MVFNFKSLFNMSVLHGVANGTKNGTTNGTNGTTTNGETDQCSYETLHEAADYLSQRTEVRPIMLIICGSGMGSLADHLTEARAFPYEDIPHFPVSTVQGHVGRLIFGYLNGVPVVVMQGRIHYYEGYPLWKCCLPIRVMKLLGVTHLIATNAAGGLNKNYKVGDIMLLKDHINIMGFAGNNPLQGPNDDRFGPRFLPMNKAYDPALIKIAKNIANQMGIGHQVHEGIYTCLGGPNFETVAELRMLGMMGVDAVGMSTVHEVVTARHCNLTVFSFSLITNECVTCYDTDDQPFHEEVMDVGKERGPVLQDFVARVVNFIGESK